MKVFSESRANRLQIADANFPEERKETKQPVPCNCAQRFAEKKMGMEFLPPPPFLRAREKVTGYEHQVPRSKVRRDRRTQVTLNEKSGRDFARRNLLPQVSCHRAASSPSDQSER